MSLPSGPSHLQAGMDSYFRSWIKKSLPFQKGRLFTRVLMPGSFGYTKKLHKIPAQMAEPITPEELQAMACISRKLLGSSFWAVI